MTSGDDWIKHMLDRGLLTPEQAQQARAEGDSPAASAPPTSPTLAGIAPPTLVSCAPCGQVFTVPGGLVDAVAPPCPKCGGPTRAVLLGGTVVPAQAAKGATGDGKRTFGKYVLGRELGRGGMGVVYEATDPSLGRTVALKMLSAPGLELDAGAVERLLREARAAARLRHAGIVAVHEIGQAEGRHYFTMELIEGPSLEQRLAAPDAWKAFPVRDRLRALLAVAEALEYAHAQGVVHRDIKPANVLFGADGRPRLSDFGLARETGALATGLTVPGVILGTPHYMSPEQARGDASTIGPSSDVFSFGVVLYRSLSGRLPFGGTGLESLHHTLHDHPPAPSRRGARLPPGAAAVCLRCLEKKPGDRYESGASLAADLRRLVGGEEVQARLPKRRATRVVRKPAGTPAAVQSQVLRVLELGRPALDRALQAQYERDADDGSIDARLEAARRQYEEAVRLSPELPLAHYLLAQTRELAGDLGGAEAGFREALRLDPDFGPAHFWLGRLLLLLAYTRRMVFGGEKADESKRRVSEAEVATAEAMQRFDAATAKGSGFDDALQRKVAEAMKALIVRDLASVNRLCEEGLAAFPKSQGREDFHWVRGILAPRDEALRDFDAALRIRPRFPMAIYARSRVLRDTGNWPAVRDDLLLVTRYWPDFAYAWLSLGIAWMRLDRDPDAGPCFERCMRLDPAFGMAWGNRGVLRFRAGDMEGAIADFSKAIELNPEVPGPYQNRAQAYVRLGKHEEAVEDFRVAVRIEPLAASMNDFGGALLRCGRTAEALQLLDETIRLHPTHTLAWNTRAAARLRTGDFKGAMTDVTEALRQKPEYPEALHNRAEIHLEWHNPSAAEADATEAIRIRPGYVNAFKRRAEARLALGRPAEARADAEEALRLSPKDEEAARIRAETYPAAGDSPSGPPAR